MPHFEKMLYDNALLMEAYTEAYQLTSKPEYEKLVQRLIQFIKQDMMNSSGSFYSAIDADSEGKEGQYYVWAKDEIITHLGKSLALYFATSITSQKRGTLKGRTSLIPFLPLLRTSKPLFRSTIKPFNPSCKKRGIFYNQSDSSDPRRLSMTRCLHLGMR